MFAQWIKTKTQDVEMLARKFNVKMEKKTNNCERRKFVMEKVNWVCKYILILSVVSWGALDVKANIERQTFLERSSVGEDGRKRYLKALKRNFLRQFNLHWAKPQVSCEFNERAEKLSWNSTFRSELLIKGARSVPTVYNPEKKGKEILIYYT